jgi:hypothetical protein
MTLVSEEVGRASTPAACETIQGEQSVSEQVHGQAFIIANRPEPIKRI